MRRRDPDDRRALAHGGTVLARERLRLWPGGVATARLVRAYARDLPWRRTRDPYAILVSEVMLQQTQVERVVPRYGAGSSAGRRSRRSRAAAPGDVIREWQGLGYNRRALDLHRAAPQVADDRLAGRPDDASGRRPVHRRGDPLLRVRGGRPAGGRERRARAAPHAARLRAGGGAGAHGSRRDRLPRARPALRHAARSRRHARRAGIREEPARKQGPFEGSFRQRRAAALRLVAGPPRAVDALDGEAVRSLERDGLVVVEQACRRTSLRSGAAYSTGQLTTTGAFAPSPGRLAERADCRGRASTRGVMPERQVTIRTSHSGV